MVIGKIIYNLIFNFKRYVEHLWGHHKHVSTPEDPASATKGESVYAFIPKSVFGTFTHAWEIQCEKLKKKNTPIISLSNDVLVMTTLSTLIIVGVGYFYGQKALLLYLVQSGKQIE